MKELVYLPFGKGIVSDDKNESLPFGCTYRNVASGETAEIQVAHDDSRPLRPLFLYVEGFKDTLYVAGFEIDSDEQISKVIRSAPIPISVFAPEVSIGRECNVACKRPIRVDSKVIIRIYNRGNASYAVSGVIVCTPDEG